MNIFYCNLFKYFFYFNRAIGFSFLLFFLSDLQAQPFIRTSGGYGQYGYIEKDASVTNFLVANGGFGNIFQYGVRTYLAGPNVTKYNYTGSGSCARGDDATSNYDNSSSALAAGNIMFSSVFVEYCGPVYSCGGSMTPATACFNERSFFVMDLEGKTDALSSNVCYNSAASNVVLSFTISNGNTSGQFLNRLWISNDGTAAEGNSNDIRNDAFLLYYEAANGSETFNGNESSAILYGDWGGNSLTNNEYGNESLNIPIPQNSTGGLRCYVVLRGTSSYLNSSAIGKTLRLAVMADGIGITPNRDVSYSRMRIDLTRPSSSSFTITNVPATPGTITGTSIQCAGATSQTYSIASVSGATSYSWTVPTGWAITTGATTNSITVTAGAVGQDGNITVTANNACGSSSSQAIAVSVTAGTPSTPGSITGNNTQCTGATNQTYTISAVSGASTYTWSVPTGWTIVSGSGTTSITVNAGTTGQNGNISVTAGNGCGTSASQSLAVSVAANPSVPTGASGATLCATGSATISASVSAGETIDWYSVSSAGSVLTGGTGVTSFSTPSISSTTSYFAQARNTTTGCLSTSRTTVTVTVNSPLDFVNTQFPTTTSSICAGSSFTAFGQVFETGLTNAAGQASGISAWLGYSSTNSDPSGSGWTWVSANFNAQVGNNDEYVATLSSLAAGTYYYAWRYQRSGCSFQYGGTSGTWANTSHNVQLNVNSTAPTATSSQSFCSGATVANLSATGTTIQWYPASIGGTALSTSTALVNGNYFATQTIGGCESQSRTQVTVTVNSLPSSPTGAVGATSCASGTAAISVANPGIGFTIDWYAVATGGTVLTNGSGVTSFTTPALSTTTTYYAAIRNTSTTCASATRTAVVVNINPTGLWIGGANGNWNVSGNWCGGIPSSSTDVIIPAGSAVTIDAAATARTITINSSATLNGSSSTLTVSGNFTNNGTFNRNTGTVIFNATATLSGTIEFNNVRLQGNVNFGTASTIHGTLTVTATGSVNTNAPFYADNSTLLYDAGTFTYNRFNEWQSGSASTDPGVPFNVQVNANTTLNMDANGSGSRTCRGSLTINGTFTMGEMPNDIIVRQDININAGGNLTLGGISDLNVGDIELGGNWNHNGGTFTNKARAVRFSGSADQTVNFGSEEVFGYVIVNKSGGNLIFNCDALIDGGNSGFPLILQNGNIDLKGKILRFNMWKAPSTLHDISISGGGVRQINSSVSGAVFAFQNGDGNSRVTTVTATVGTFLSFGANVTVTIGATTSGVNFAGVDFGNNVTTINQTLQINNGGYVKTNPPTYATNSLLKYNITGEYKRSDEWKTTSNVGYPFNVQLSNTTLFLPGGYISSPDFRNTFLNMAGSLTIDAGTTFDMNNSGLNSMTVPLIVGLDLNLNGTLIASSDVNAHIQVGRDWTRNTAAVFTPNNKKVIFNSSNNSTINLSNSGTETFHILETAKTLTTNLITLSKPVAITNSVIFGTGRIISSYTNPLIVGHNATVSGASDNSFVDGPVRKVGQVASPPFVFPVGKPISGTSIVIGGYRSLSISNPSNSTDEFTCEFYLGNSYGLGTVSAPLTRVSSCEYWRLDRVGSSAVNVTLSWNSKSKCVIGNYVTNPATLVVARSSATGNPYLSNGIWTSLGRAGGSSGNNSEGTVTATGVSQFSPFTLGTESVTENPLPFYLLSFMGKIASTHAQLDWSAGGNDEQKEYWVEHSTDGVNFKVIKVVTAKPVLEKASYSSFHANPSDGWNFYRITAVALNGDKKQTHIVRLYFGKAARISLSPNPVSSSLNLTIPEPEKVNAVALYNAAGQFIKEFRGLRSSQTIDVSQYPAGHYLLRVLSHQGVLTIPFVKR
ncbi:MAG: T9SS type A sorting domain-containing protein [Bacteroidetes bacterium]|nr:T9SS type A sorting domain-containing protein [Bacteroidota bacterium]